MTTPVTLRITLDDSARGLPLPDYATAGSAGLDLRAALREDEIIVLNPGDRGLIPTGIRLAIPLGFEGQVRARSGLALKHGIALVNAPGTIDSDYRGEVKILLINLGSEPFSILRGDRIAQLIISPVARAELIVVPADEMDATERGVGGYGSTGVNAANSADKG